MVDIMSGPNYPLAKGFEMAGWRIFPVDILFGDEHDLSKLDNQEKIRQQLKQADFIWAALDCSDKTRIREIQRKMVDPCLLHCEAWNTLWDCQISKAIIKKGWQRVMRPPSSFLGN